VVGTDNGSPFGGNALGLGPSPQFAFDVEHLVRYSIFDLASSSSKHSQGHVLWGLEVVT
jgi:hypothetical protein